MRDNEFINLNNFTTKLECEIDQDAYCLADPPYVFKAKQLKCLPNYQLKQSSIKSNYDPKMKISKVNQFLQLTI